MPSDQIIQFVKKRLNKGVRKKVIKEALLEIGFNNQQVKEIFEKVEGETKEPKTPKASLETSKVSFLTKIKSKIPSFSFFKTMNLKKPLGIILALLIIGGASFLLYNEFAKTDPISLLPKETSTYVRVKIDPEHQQVKNLKNLLNKFPLYNKLEKQMKKGLKDIKKEAFRSEDVDLAISEELIIASPASFSKMQEKEEPPIILMLPDVDVQKLNNLQKQIKEDTEKDKESKLEEEKYRGVTINKIVEVKKEKDKDQPYFGEPLDKEPFEPCFVFLKGHLIFTSELKDIKKVIDVAKDHEIKNTFKENKAESITSKAIHQKAREYLPEKYLVLFYGNVNMEEIMSAAEETEAAQQAKSLPVIGSSLKASLSFLKNEPLSDKERALAGVIVAKNNKIESETYSLGIEDSSIPEGFSLEESLVNSVPEKTDGLKTIHYSEGRNLNKGYQALKKELLKDKKEKQKKEFNEGLKQLKEELGIDIESMFNSLKENYSFFLMTDHTGKKAPVLAFMAETENPEQLKENLSELELPKELVNPMETISESSRAKARDARISADMGQIRSQAELNYSQNGDYRNVDYTPGGTDNIDQLGKDIADQGGSLKVFNNGIVQYESPKYCAYTELNEPQAYYCINSSGEALSTYNNPKNSCNTNSFSCPPQGEKPPRGTVEIKETVGFSKHVLQGIEIYAIPIIGKLELAFTVNDNKLVFTTNKKVIPKIVKSWENDDLKMLKENEQFSNEFKNVPGKVTSISYASPRGYTGILKYLGGMVIKAYFGAGPESMPNPEAANEMINEFVDKGINPYLKVLKVSSSYSYSPEPKVVVNKASLTFESLPKEEKEKTEEFWNNIDTWLQRKSNELMGYSTPLGGARAKAKDARITSDIGQLRAKAELIYSDKGSYNKFSCSYDNETETLCSDVSSQGGNVVIHSSSNKYCAYSNLVSSQDFYCIDSSGDAIEVSTNPGSTCNANSFECPSGF